MVSTNSTQLFTLQHPSSKSQAQAEQGTACCQVTSSVGGRRLIHVSILDFDYFPDQKRELTGAAPDVIPVVFEVDVVLFTAAT